MLIRLLSAGLIASCLSANAQEMADIKTYCMSDRYRQDPDDPADRQLLAADLRDYNRQASRCHLKPSKRRPLNSNS